MRSTYFGGEDQERLETWLEDAYDTFPDGIDYVWHDGEGVTLEEPLDVERFADLMDEEGYRVDGGEEPDEPVSVMAPILHDGEQRGWVKYGTTFHPDRDLAFGGAAIGPDGEPMGDTIRGTLDLLTIYLEAVYGGA